jgi:hypothetical protein
MYFLGDAETVHRPSVEHAQHEQVERALKQISFVFSGHGEVVPP